MRTLPLLALLIVAGCKSAPGKQIKAQDVMTYAPASVASNEAGLQVCILPARRYDSLAAAPGKKTMLVVPLTRADGTVGEPIYAGTLGYPVTLAARPPFFLTLNDGFLRVDAKERDLVATVEGAKGGAPAPLTSKDELWVWIGREPSEKEPDPRGTFVGVRVAR
jgi:hypothetical protein